MTLLDAGVLNDLLVSMFLQKHGLLPPPQQMLKLCLIMKWVTTLTTVWKTFYSLIITAGPRLKSFCASLKLTGKAMKHYEKSTLLGM